MFDEANNIVANTMFQSIHIRNIFLDTTVVTPRRMKCVNTNFMGCCRFLQLIHWVTIDVHSEIITLNLEHQDTAEVHFSATLDFKHLIMLNYLQVCFDRTYFRIMISYNLQKFIILINGRYTQNAKHGYLHTACFSQFLYHNLLKLLCFFNRFAFYSITTLRNTIWVKL